jgi:proteic killer suppression protein
MQGKALSPVSVIQPIDKCKVTGYTHQVKIQNFLHKGLKRLYEQGDPRGLPPPSVDKLRKIIVYLEAMDGVDELRNVPTWKAHLLTGSRKGTWSLHVTRNWRMTFWIDNAEREICDVNFEDYH